MSKHKTFEWISPLRYADQNFLEVLVHDFTICRKPENGGFSLNLEFGPESPAIWHRRGKDEVHEKLITNFSEKSRKYGAELESFFFENKLDQYDFNDQTFPFRYCSGGALPIITIGEKQYYRLHWRDIHPVGWNITNGGSDSLVEMLDPSRIIKRELFEELVVFDLKSNPPCRLVLGETGIGGDAFPSEAWRLWHAHIMSRKRNINSAAFTNKPLPCGWLHGPDDLTVTYHGTGPSDHLPHCADGFLLNINAEDFGIEVDRVVRIDLPETAVICDGELISGYLLNSPIGLFEVQAMREAIQKGSTDFRPDILFFNAERHNPANLEKVVKAFLEEKRRNGLLPDIEIRQLEEADAKGQKFDLCPVSRTVIRRCMELVARDTSPDIGELDVFLSFASEDEEHAQKVHDWLMSHGKHRVFFSPESIRESNFTRAIFTALEQARNLVVVGTKLDHLRKNWVSYECLSFFIKMMREQNGKRQIFTVLPGLSADTTPPAPLDVSTVIACSEESLAENLEVLLASLG
ncbi:MAG TPA: toll/interleukin-1 receptor domain-containing protein [Candidatus Hydrogenedentes bacterium]|nr:toll/interleukin-1 receptor domain-containing protein [Candidatus Hydrogenedentota bacterium]